MPALSQNLDIALLPTAWLGAGRSCYSVLCLRGLLPPTTPRPGHALFHASMVLGFHPRVDSMSASGLGSL